MSKIDIISTFNNDQGVAMSEKLQINDSEIEQRFNEIVGAEFTTVALNGTVGEAAQNTPAEFTTNAIDEVEVTKHSSKAASRAKAFASISGSGCTDD